jgi:D-beta-D-heptose 7-phosphate kinase/D-beta-D-heptose 1-phosphate adenosyltransferase
MAPDARTVFERASNLRIMVVGDVMIDEWIWGTVTRISPEAPVPVVAVADHSFTLGGAGNVANNLRALHAGVVFAGAVGSDAFASQVRDLLRGEQVDDSGVFTILDRPTTRKTRIVAHNQQVVRADWESTATLSDVDRGRLAAFVRERAPQCDAVILSDYAKGLLCREIVEAASGCSLVLADPKPQNTALYSGITCVAPNGRACD